jgi:hypothetical protein
MKKKPLYLTIHGHFYQPPRENPWTGRIEEQPSAAPAHDWNDRIAKECYTPNSASRILGPWGRIEDVVNNYEYMSFNMGPTLMSWLRTNTPETYKRIQDADKKSAERLNGHGNAVAQVFNHIIMPLATPEDRITQIRWGVQDFEFHFGRKPEAIWLAETAINMDTVVDLINEGIRYIILSPTQAEAFRPLDSKSKEWQGCENTDIDPTRPYRIFPRSADGTALCPGHLDVFFYDASLSSAVGFEHLLRDANLFADKISGAFNKDRKEPQLIQIGTDGESYGHHEPYGDMCAAYLFKKHAPEKDMIPVNYGWFLEEFPPEYEVRLKNWYGEGCAWSCAHGVGRWYRDCGCSTGAPEGWNQKWRGPLREAFDFVKKEADRILEEEAQRLGIKDPWQARNSYGRVLRDPQNPKVRQEFSAEILGSDATEEEQESLIRIMEAQKFSMFTYTSCGWFFNDILGLEPMHNMRYALRAMEILRPWIPNYTNWETKFLDILAQAQSNQDGRTGAEIFEQDIRQKIPVTARIAASYAIASLLEIDSEQIIEPAYSVEITEQQRFAGHFFAAYHLKHKETFEEETIFAWAQEESHNGVSCLSWTQERSLPNELNLFQWEEFRKHSGIEHCTMDMLIPDTVNQISRNLAERAREELQQEVDKFAERFHLQAELLQSGTHILGDSIFRVLGLREGLRLKDSLFRLLDGGGREIFWECRDIWQRIQDWKVDVQLDSYSDMLANRLQELVQEALAKPSPGVLQQTTDLISLADMMHIDIHRSELENMAFPYYQAYKEEPEGANQNLKPLLEWLNFEL